MNTFDLLQTLTETPGPSGFEEGIAMVIQEMWTPLVDESHIDRVGSLVGVKRGTGDAPRRKILLAAHMDEIGLMVSNIIEAHGHGFLRVTGIGGVDIRHLFNQPVVVHGKSHLPGLLASIPGSMLPKKKQGKPYDLETLVVDTGLEIARLRELVSVGDAVSFKRPLRKLLNSRVTGKALDNRASVAALTLCLETLQSRPHSWDVIAAATCQEETRLLGGATATYTHQPDIAIAIDVTFGQGPSSSDFRTFKLGGGPVIGYMPDVHPGIAASLKKAADEVEMKVQLEHNPRPGGTDAYAMQISRAGVPTGIVGIPLRYMHTMVESAHLKDIERVGRLLAEYICQLTETTLNDLQKAFLA